MSYSKYTNMPNDELIALALNASTIDPLVYELATRLIAAEDELGDVVTSDIEDVLEAVDSLSQEGRRRVRVWQD